MLLASGLMKRSLRTIGTVDSKGLKENHYYVYELEIVSNHTFSHDHCKST